MSSDAILTAEDGKKYSYDNIRTGGWLYGHECGAEAVSGWLMKQATAAFECGRDEEAKKLRMLAQEIKKAIMPEMRKRAEEHEKDYPDEIAKEVSDE